MHPYDFFGWWSPSTAVDGVDEKDGVSQGLLQPNSVSFHMHFC